jgi:hypothetical protein
MAAKNNSNGPGKNTTSEFSLSISDTSDHDLPDTNGDDESTAQDAYDARTHERLAATVINQQDAALDATLERADTTADTDFYVDVGSTTVSKNGGVQTLAADPDVPLRRFRVVVTFQSSPSGTDDTIVRFNPGWSA